MFNQRDMKTIERKNLISLKIKSIQRAKSVYKCKICLKNTSCKQKGIRKNIRKKIKVNTCEESKKYDCVVKNKFKIKVRFLKKEEFVKLSGITSQLKLCK